MAKDNIIGLAMNLDVSDIKSGIAEVKKQIQQSKRDFESASAGLDNWKKSSEGLSAKLSQLDSDMKSQGQMVAGYKAEIQRLSEMEGDHSAQIEKVKVKLQQAETSLAKTAKSASNFRAELEKVKAKEDEAKSATAQLSQKMADQQSKVDKLSKAYKDSVLSSGESSKASKDLAKQLQSATKELQKTKDEAGKADTALAKLGDSAKTSSSKLESISSIGKKATGALKKLGLGATGLVTGFLATAESTRELRTNLGKIDTAFKDNGFSAKDATKTYEDLYSVLGDSDQATETANLLSSLADDQEDLQKWTEISTGVFAKFGDSLPVESLAEASNETAKTGEITGSLADALNWAGVSQDDFQKKLDKCNTEQERQSLITETLTGLYGDASTQYKETNKDIIASNKAQAELSQKMAEVGKIAEPMMTSLRQLGVTVLDAILPIVQEWMPKIQANLPQIASAIAGIVAVMATLSVVTIAQKVAMTALSLVMNGYKAVVNGIKIAQMALNAVMALNPATLIILGITALIAVFILLWKNCDGFREFWIDLWDKIKSACGKAWDAIVGFFKDSWDKAKSAWDGAKEFFSNLWDKIKDAFSDVKSWFSDKFKSAWEGIKNAWSNVKSFFKDKYNDVIDSFKNIGSKIGDFFSKAWDKAKSAWSSVKSFFKERYDNVVTNFTNLPSKIKDFFSKAWNNVKDAWSNVKKFFTETGDKILDAFKSLPDKMKNIGKDLIEGLKNGIENAKDAVVQKAKDIGSAVINKFKNVFDSHSPSRVMEDLGEDVGKGLENGIGNSQKGILSKVGDLGGEILDFFGDLLTGTDMMGGIKKLFSKLGDMLGDAGKTILDGIAKALGLDFSNMFAETATTASKKAEKALENIANPSMWSKIKGKTKKALDDLAKYFDNWANSSVKKYMDQVIGYMDKVISKTQELSSAQLAYQNQIAENQKADLDAQLDKFKKINEHQIESYTKGKEDEISKSEASTQKQLEILEEQNKKGLIFSGEYTRKKEELEARLAETTKQKQDEIAKYTELKNKQTEAQEENINKKKNEIAEKQFKAQQKNDIANATIQGALAIVKGYADLGPVAGAINAGLQASITATQIRTIKAQRFVPALAKGGVADRATLAMIGESGKEAVIPLERNTSWMNAFAEKLTAIMQKDFVGSLATNTSMGSNVIGGASNVSNNFTQIINAPKTPSRRELYRDSKNLLALKGI